MSLEKEKSSILNDWWWLSVHPAIETAVAIGLLVFMFFKITAKALYRRLIGKRRKGAKTENNLMVRRERNDEREQLNGKKRR